MAIKIPPIVRTQEASDTPFDNSTNGFVSDNVQDAIEEAASASSDDDTCLREVTMVMYPFGPVNITSNLLFEADPVNDTILFLGEKNS